MTHHEVSQRQLRFGEMVRHALAEILLRDVVQDPEFDLRLITVPEVRMSVDLRIATAYVLPLGGQNKDQALAALERNNAFIRGALSKTVKTKFMPKLRFKLDDSFDRGSHIENLLRGIKQ